MPNQYGVSETIICLPNYHEKTVNVKMYNLTFKLCVVGGIGEDLSETGIDLQLC